MPFRTATLMIVLAALAVSGCGRRGALEDPAGPDAAAAEAAAIPGNADNASPGAMAPEAERPPRAPQRSFILDPLI